MSLTSHTIDIGAVVTGNEGIVLQPDAAGVSIGLDDTESATYALTTTELTTNLASTGTVTIGRADGSATIDIGSAIDLSGESYDVTLRVLEKLLDMEPCRAERVRVFFFCFSFHFGRRLLQADLELLVVIEPSVSEST